MSQDRAVSAEDVLLGRKSISGLRSIHSLTGVAMARSTIDPSRRSKNAKRREREAATNGLPTL